MNQGSYSSTKPSNASMASIPWEDLQWATINPTLSKPVQLAGVLKTLVSKSCTEQNTHEVRLPSVNYLSAMMHCNHKEVMDALGELTHSGYECMVDLKANHVRVTSH